MRVRIPPLAFRCGEAPVGSGHRFVKPAVAGSTPAATVRRAPDRACESCGDVRARPGRPRLDNLVAARSSKSRIPVLQTGDAGANPARAALRGGGEVPCGPHTPETRVQIAPPPFENLSARPHGVSVHTRTLLVRASDRHQKVQVRSLLRQPSRTRLARRIVRPAGRTARRLPHTQEDVVRLHGRAFAALNALADEPPALNRVNPARFRTGPFRGDKGRQRPARFGAASSLVQVQGLRLFREPPWPNRQAPRS